MPEQCAKCGKDAESGNVCRACLAVRAQIEKELREESDPWEARYLEHELEGFDA